MQIRGASLAFLFAVAFACATSLSGCGPGERDDVLYVYAAASLQDALTEVNASFREETGIKVVLNAGSSGTLAMQIEQGGRCDVFLSAGEKEMDRVQALGLVDVASRRALLSNQLVVIVPAGERAVGAPEDLAGDAVRHLSLADPESVPAGRYAKEWLVRAGLWESVEGKVLQGTDVRAALSQVEFGGAEAGIVYRTDAAISDKVEIAYAVPIEEGPRIVYPAAAMADRPRPKQSLAYLEHLRSPGARQVFVEHGFLPDEGS